MSAIKNFFDHSREVARLSKERAIEKQRKLQTPTKVVVDTTYEDNLLKEEIKYFDGVLRRNWFIDDNDIVELLNMSEIHQLQPPQLVNQPQTARKAIQSEQVITLTTSIKDLSF